MKRIAPEASEKANQGCVKGDEYESSVPIAVTGDSSEVPRLATVSGGWRV